MPYTYGGRKIDMAGQWEGMRDWIIARYYRFLEVLMGPLARRGISPNSLTVLSLVLSVLAGVLFATGMFLAGGIVLVVAGILDTMDGTIARLQGRETSFGALLDSTLDRYGDAVILCGFIFYFRDVWILYVVIAALVGSLLVSYVKARAESLGDVRITGMMQRPERFGLLALGAILNRFLEPYSPLPDGCVTVILVILACVTHYTAISRLKEARNQLTEDSRGEGTKG